MVRGICKHETMSLVAQQSTESQELDNFFKQWYDFHASVGEVPNIYELYSGESEQFSMSAYSSLIVDLAKEGHPGSSHEVFTEWDSVEDIIDYYLLDYHVSTLSDVLRHRLITLSIRNSLFILNDERTSGDLMRLNDPFESVW